MTYLEPWEHETENAKIRVTFENRTDEEREMIFKNMAQTIYELCLSEYKKGIKTNENNNDEGSTKLT